MCPGRRERSNPTPQKERLARNQRGLCTTLPPWLYNERILSPSPNSQRCLPLCLFSYPVTRKTLCLSKHQEQKLRVAGVEDSKPKYTSFHLNLHKCEFNFLVQCRNKDDGTPCETCESKKKVCEYTQVAPANTTAPPRSPTSTDSVMTDSSVMTRHSSDPSGVVQQGITDPKCL
jgi:hypothetical protein